MTAILTDTTAITVLTDWLTDRLTDSYKKKTHTKTIINLKYNL
jgi:hypothetical protein